MSNTTSKGIAMEELLRNYFDSSGFYAVRGAYLKIDGSAVTDIDIWLYNKSSPLTRERINVDCKNKKSSQARERIIWTKGIQNIIKTDKCIVATRDKSPQVKAFGFQNEVIVMTGDFISDLFNSSLIKQNKRLTEEEFYNIITPKGISSDADRQIFYEEGIKYGKNGRQYLVEVSEMISSLLIFKDGPNIMYELDRNFDQLPYKILSEYFSKRVFLKTAFEQGKQFDNLSRIKNEEELYSINKSLMSTIFVLCDFHGIDRTRYPVNIKLE